MIEPVVSGPLRRIVERHGDHEGQEGRPGEAGGSKPGFTHGDNGEWGPTEDGYATWYDGDKLVKIIADNEDGTYDLEVVSGHDRGAFYDNTPADELNEPDEDEIELWTSRGADGSINRAVESFGLTENPNEGGYILEDGTMLNFSGSNQGGSPGRRELDHRDIGRILMEVEPGGTEGMIHFMDQTRSIRMSMTSGDLNIDFAHTPTRSQKETIEYIGAGVEAIYWDFTNWNPETKKYWRADSGSIDSPTFEDIRQLWRDVKTASWKERHYAPTHPGTGTGQDVHAGEAHTTYPLVGDTVDGREVVLPVPNTSSISASLTDWEELEGIREVPVSDFFEEGEQPYYYSVGKKESTMELAAALETSGWIEPLIVVIDREGAYVLEGGHRLDALREIGAKSFPALVVVDREQIPEAVERGKIPTGIMKSIDEFMDSIAALFGIE